jgi:CRP-like cAMP-binding protein
LSHDDLLKFLRSHTIFSDLDPAHIEILAKHASEKSFVAGDLLFRQEDPAEHFYILIEGSIQVEVPAIMGPALVVQTLGADEVLGWSWLIPPYKWTFEAKAQSDSQVLVFDGKTLLQLCEKDTDFGYALMKRFTGLMSQRLHAARLKMMDSWAPAGWA